MPHDLQNEVQSILNQAVANGQERGVQAAIYLDGKLAVDAWAGVADVRTGRPVEGDTFFPVFSTTKGYFSTIIHILAERGLIEYDSPIAHYWPEFAANGKAEITVRQGLCHQSGIPFMPDNVDAEQTADWDYMCRLVAQLTPAWKPGTRQDYHPVTFGWIVGEVARRADGRHIPQLMEEEICRPLGMKHLYCGIPAELESQTAYLEEYPVPEPPTTPPPYGISPSMIPLHEWMNRPDVRRTPHPGSSGIASARAIARHYAALLPGGVDGVELVPPSCIRKATEIQVPVGGFELNDNARRGLGYAIDAGTPERPQHPLAFGHDGYGGSTGYAYPQYRLALSVTRNRYVESRVRSQIWAAIHRTLGLA